MYKILHHARGIKLIDFYNENNFHVVLSNYGASIYQIDMPNINNEIECITLTPLSTNYFKNSKYYGLTVGRVAGRIKGNTFKIDGETYKIEANDRGNILHSGINSLSYKFYDFDITDNPIETVVTYSLNVKNMEDSFPGNLELHVIYTLKKKTDDIRIDYEAYSSKDTFLNLTNHTYFNLSGNYNRSIEDEYLTINKSYLAQTDETQAIIYIESLKNEFDFRKTKMIGQDLHKESVQVPFNGYDHTYTDTKPVKVMLYDDISKRELLIESDYKDVTIYTNNTSNGTVLLNNIEDKEYYGIAIEPSRITKVLDESSLLQRARTLYKHYIEYKFKVRK